MKSKRIVSIMITVLMAVTFAFTTVSFASSVAVAPSFMPGFPMLAGDNIMVMWVPVPGATKYKIYQNGKEIGEASGPPFTTPAPTVAGVYKYTIAGVDAAGAQGPVSKESVLSIIKIEQPKDIIHRFIGDTLNISWTPAPNTEIYDIYRSDAADGQFNLIASITEDKFVDSEIKRSENAEKTFFYKIVSKDKFNKTSPDKEIYEVKIEKAVAAAMKMKDLTLKIRRSKQEFIRMLWEMSLRLLINMATV
jgi:hypothetical protein